MTRPVRAIAEHPLQSLVAAVVIVSSVALLATPYYALAALPGMGLLLLLLLLRKPEFGFYLIVAMIPFGAYRGLSGPYSAVRFHWIIAAVLLIGTFLQHVREKRLSERLPTNLWPLFVAFTVVSLVSALLSPTPGIALKEVLLLAAGYLFVILSQLFLSQRGFSVTLTSVIIWSISAGSLLAVLGHLGFAPFGAAGAASGGTPRSEGGTTDPNQLALVVIFVVPFLVHWLTRARRGVTRAAAAALLLLNLAAMVTTLSRGGALGLVAITLCLFIENRRRIRPAHLGHILAAIALAIVLATMLVPRTYWERQRSLTSASDVSISRRKTYFIAGWEAVRSRLLLGTGPGTYSEVYARSSYAQLFARGNERKTLYRDAHNTYLQILVETGILGLLCFFAILVRTWRNLSRARNAAAAADNEELALVIGTYRTAFAGLLLYFFIISNPLNKYLLLCFALSQVALRIAASRQDAPNDEVAHVS
jgi:putative inorganic carbon (hco3(-)) transporter